MGDKHKEGDGYQDLGRTLGMFLGMVETGGRSREWTRPTEPSGFC